MGRQMSTLAAETAHSFTLVISGVAELSRAVLNRLFEAGCDDATFGGRDGYVYGDFDREAPTFADAVSSAIEQVEATGLRVMRVEPEELVSASEIARGPNDRAKASACLSQASEDPVVFRRPWVGWTRRRESGDGQTLAAGS